MWTQERVGTFGTGPFLLLKSTERYVLAGRAGSGRWVLLLMLGFVEAGVCSAVT